jgi:hypothetical protein
MQVLQRPAPDYLLPSSSSLIPLSLRSRGRTSCVVADIVPAGPWLDGACRWHEEWMPLGVRVPHSILHWVARSRTANSEANPGA